MNRAIAVILGLALVAILPGLAHAQNAGLRRCTKTTEITSDTSVSISTRPAIVCSVQFIATESNGFGVVFDSPDNTAQNSVEHGQFRVIAEPGQATSGNSITHPFGDDGFLTNFGLGAYVVRGRMIVHWDDN